MSGPASLRNLISVLVVLGLNLPALAVADGPNEILRTLLTAGVPIAAGERVRLPEPTLTDGMTAAAQREQIERIAEGSNSWEDLTRRTVVAPFVLRTAHGGTRQPQLGRRVDMWFIAYGSLNTLAGDEFFRGQFKTASEDAGNASSARLLDETDLKKRGLMVPAAADDPRYLAVETTLLERVRVSLTTRSVRTRTVDSLVVASIIDPRFADDLDFPNSWRSILRDDAGTRRLGEPQAYRGLGSYVKATRLVEPAGAIVIEYHLVYKEPREWFDGANLLQSKLPILAQTAVRKVRRSLATP